MAAIASVVAGVGSGVIQTRRMPRDRDDGGLAVQPRAVRQLRVEGQRHGRHRDDLAAHREHAVGLPHAFLEVAGDVGQGGDEQVAEGVAGEARGVARRGWESGTGAGCVMAGSASASAAMHMRMSPIGRDAQLRRAACRTSRRRRRPSPRP